MRCFPQHCRLPAPRISTRSPMPWTSTTTTCVPPDRLYGDLPRGRRGPGRVGYPVAEKAAQDALGIPFSQGEAVRQRRQQWSGSTCRRNGRCGRREFKKLDDLRSPIAFLLGKTKLENELQGLSKVVDQSPQTPGNTLLRGIPKAMADRVSEVLLEVTPSSQIARIVLTEVDGATTEFRFSSPKENLEVSDHSLPVHAAPRRRNGRRRTGP